MSKNNTPAAVDKTAFDCPLCGVFTTQHWNGLYAVRMDPSHPKPITSANILSEEQIASSRQDEQESLRKYRNIVLSGMISVSEDWGSVSRSSHVTNLHISECYACGLFSVWVGTRLVDPQPRLGVPPNDDLPDDVKRDFNEASSIVNVSPRGAAALLRLCVQKLCKHLGEKGKNIDDDIAALVKKGLSPLVQKALDVVRVVGNEAVHPGTIDLNDDPGTAQSLFGLVNAIADQMIAHPKHVNDLYAKLPQSKREAIERRDGK